MYHKHCIGPCGVIWWILFRSEYDLHGWMGFKFSLQVTLGFIFQVTKDCKFHVTVDFRFQGTRGYKFQVIMDLKFQVINSTLVFLCVSCRAKWWRCFSGQPSFCIIMTTACTDPGGAEHRLQMSEETWTSANWNSADCLMGGKIVFVTKTICWVYVYVVSHYKMEKRKNSQK